MTYSNRFEAKYIVPISQYKEMLEYLKPFTKPDPHGTTSGTYNVRTLYFDSPSMDFFHDKVEGEKDRYKVRVRTYFAPDGARSKTVLEIKYRLNRNIMKIKAKIGEEEAKSFIKRPDLEKFSNIDHESMQTLTEVSKLAYRYHLKPSVIVTYIRHAFIGLYSPNLRITFDLNVKYRRRDYSLDNWGFNRYIIPPHKVILEIKYSGMFPVWIKNMAARFNLQMESVSKYGKSIEKFVD